MPKKKTFLYIDGTNLLAGLIDMFGFGKVPTFSSILKNIRKYYNYDEIFFYASYTSPKGIKKLTLSKQEEIKKQIGLEIEFYKEARETKNLLFYQGYRSPASKKEKGVDVHLAIDFVKDAFLKKYNNSIIFTGDADLIYAVQVTKTLGFEVSSVFVASRFSRGIMFESQSSLILDFNSTFPIIKFKNLSNKLKIVSIRMKSQSAQKNPRSKRAR
jgi:uncharacterized LabA/DUF88 family protein